MNDREREEYVANVLEEHANVTIGKVAALDAWVRRVTWLAVGLSAVTLLIVICGFAAVAYLLDQIQTDRYHAIVAICEAQDKQAQGIQKFVAHVNTDLLPQAQKLFPVGTDCDKLARDTGAQP